MPDNLFPAPAFDGCDLDVILEEDVDALIKMALLAEMGLTPAEARAWVNLCGKAAS